MVSYEMFVKYSITSLAIMLYKLCIMSDFFFIFSKKLSLFFLLNLMEILTQKVKDIEISAF